MTKPNQRGDAPVLAIDREIYNLLLMHVPREIFGRVDCSCGRWFASIFGWADHVAEAIAERLREIG